MSLPVDSPLAMTMDSLLAMDRRIHAMNPSDSAMTAIILKFKIVAITSKFEVVDHGQGPWIHAMNPSDWAVTAIMLKFKVAPDGLTTVTTSIRPSSW